MYLNHMKRRSRFPMLSKVMPSYICIISILKNVLALYNALVT